MKGRARVKLVQAQVWSWRSRAESRIGSGKAIGVEGSKSGIGIQDFRWMLVSNTFCHEMTAKQLP